jgi:anti-repressor protein
MANQLIPVFSGTISNEAALLCDARELHIFLGVNRDFSNWIRDRIVDYGFVQNKDYILLAKNGEQRKGRGGHNRKEYYLTLDTAKELAMVERNDKGRQLRRYFIECEKKLHGKYLPVIQPVAALPESDKVPHPTTLEFDIPEPMVIVKGSAVSQLNALFSTVEYL